MQEAIVTCTRAAAFGTSCIVDIKWAALVQVTIAACAVGQFCHQLVHLLYWHMWF